MSIPEQLHLLEYELKLLTPGRLPLQSIQEVGVVVQWDCCFSPELFKSSKLNF